MKKVCICLICLVLIFSFITGCENKSNISTLRIGVSGINDLEVCREYLDNNVPFEELSYELIDLGEGTKDSFTNVCDNMETLIRNKKIDMIIGIPEDYINSLSDDLLLDLSSQYSSTCLPAVEAHLNKSKTEILYLPHTFYCSRFFIVNMDLMNKLQLSTPPSNGKIDDLINWVIDANKKILKTEKTDIYPVSFGSPYDEFLYDDIANFLLPMGFPRTESGKQKRFFNDEYISAYRKLYKCATTFSYNRKDIGYEYPLDYYFTTGKVLLKVATAFELKAFMNESTDAPFNTYIRDFNYKVIPISSVLNTQSTVVAISKESKLKRQCMNVLHFLMSEQYALDIIDNVSPFLIDRCSLPCITSKKIEERLLSLYGISSLKSYADYTTYAFAKNSNIHWGVIDQENQIFHSRNGGDIDRIIKSLKEINK